MDTRAKEVTEAAQENVTKTAAKELTAVETEVQAVGVTPAVEEMAAEEVAETAEAAAETVEAETAEVEAETAEVEAAAETAEVEAAVAAADVAGSK